MSSNEEDERELLKGAFPNEKWAKKVDRLSDAEVVAIILRLRQQGKL